MDVGLLDQSERPGPSNRHESEDKKRTEGGKAKGNDSSTKKVDRTVGGLRTPDQTTITGAPGGRTGEENRPRGGKPQDGNEGKPWHIKGGTAYLVKSVNLGV